MKISQTNFKGRKGWQLDNGALSLVVLQGGGHIASATLATHPKINPFWVPVWKGLEPWQYDARKHKSKYELKLLASICGHNLCLGWFGDPSESEARQGLEGHGEAPVARWTLKRKSVSKTMASLTVGCELPISQMHVQRTLKSRAGSKVVYVEERVRNTSRRDLPFTMCQHVTVAAPFLEKGVTVFDAPATKGHTVKAGFSDCPRLKSDTAFTWPVGPGAKGEDVDMRQITSRYRKSSDFSTNLMDPKREKAWFSAMNPKQGVMLAYIWDRADYPWLGNWEENYGRSAAPWAGKSLTRGMEFSNTPWAQSLRDAVNLGRFQGQPTFRWLPARSSLTFKYAIVMLPVEKDVKAVHDITPSKRGFEIALEI